MLDFDISIWLLGILLLIMYCVYLRKKRNEEFISVFFNALFFIYILQVLRFTIFPIPIFSPTIREISSKIDILSTMNIKPFANITLNRQFYYNILLTIPFGFLLPLLRNKSIKKVLLKGIAFSISVELLQLLISFLIKFPYRTCDINDIILNTFGVFMGFVLWKLFTVILKAITKKSNLKNDKFINYILGQKNI
ncbi:VanZ family protein [Caldicellulosiruptor sp. DIB 104C]|uniref:VanZ family protein n=2 Tax=unclassified Caldicellulosiruptor TaxID=2622462 RepID=UPI0023062168|nr:VanZ family protein [Caldicellulosiruptor sp. DIB 104C]